MADEELNQAQENMEEMPLQENTLPYYLQNNKITMDDIRKHAGGPALSLVVHVIILILLATIVISDPPQKEVEEIQVEMKEVKPVPPPPPPPPEPIPEVSEIITPTDVPFERPTIQTEAVTMTASVDNVTTGSEMSDVPAPAISLSAAPSNSALKMPGLMRQRTAGGIRSSLKMYGGTRQGEDAVMRALRWLAKVQNEDGSWGENDPRKQPNVAISSIATLAFLAHGETPQSAEFGDTMLRALKQLATLADSAPATGTSYGNGYSHAMLAYAISEGFAMTKIPMLERAMNKLVNSIVQGQNPAGGFDYNFSKRGATVDAKTGQVLGGMQLGEYRCDLSLGGWCYQAMKAAYAGGCSVDGLGKAMSRGSKCIRTTNCADKTGGFTYVRSINGSGASVSMTSVGTLCLQLYGEGKTREALNGMKWLEAYKPAGLEDEILQMNWKLAAEKNTAGSMPLYTWYYLTQAIFQGYSGDGKIWDKWNKSFRNTLTKEQSREGYWDSPTAKYSKIVKKELCDGGLGNFGTQLGQRVWSTGLCTLMLEVYYRFLPTFKTVEHDAPAEGGSAADEEESEDDLSL